MSAHAGFAAAIALRQGMLQDMVRVLYRAGRLPHSLGGTVPSFSANLHLSVPQLVFLASNGNRVGLDLVAWGPMTVQRPGGAAEMRGVVFRARVLAPFLATLSESRLVFRVNASSAEVSSVQIVPFVGGPYSADTRTYLESDGFRGLLTLAVQVQLGSIAEIFPPLDVSFLGAIASAPGTRVQVRVLDGALGLGLDVNAGGVSTTGSAAALTDFTAGNDIAMWTNPVALPVAFGSVRDQVQSTVTAQGSTLDSFSFGVEEGGFRIRGSASRSEGSVAFSLKAVPRLVRPGRTESWVDEDGRRYSYSTPDREELWFQTQDVQVDVSPAWWVRLLEVLGGVLTVGIGVAIVESMVDMIRGNVSRGISGSGGSTLAARVRTFTLPGTTEPEVVMRIARFSCHDTGVFMGIALRPQFSGPRLEGPTSVSAEEAVTGPLTYRVTLPFDDAPEDPQLRVRWTVRRSDTHAVVHTREGAAMGYRELSLSGTVMPLSDASEFRIEVRVYRVLGPSTEERFSGEIRLAIHDVLDRTRPFVQWSHFLHVPVVRVEPDGTRTLVGYEYKERHSDIHRTDLPGRCRMAGRYSSKVVNPFTGQSSLQYLDALPFPREALAANRARVCDYCFYGGPTRTVPIYP